MSCFSYNGISSKSLGIRIESRDISSAPGYEQTFQTIPGRHGELILNDGRFKNVKLHYRCYVLEKNKEKLDERLIALKAVLYQGISRYGRLEDSYQESFFRKAVFCGRLNVDVTFTRLARMTVQFIALPFLYSKDGERELKITASSGHVLENPFFLSADPLITVTGEGAGSFTLEGLDENKRPLKTHWSVKELNGDTVIDTEKMLVTKEGRPANNTLVGEGFPILLPGKNKLSFDGGISSITVKPRWRTI